MRPLGLPGVEMPRLGLAAFQRRLLFRGVFLLLALATLSLAVVLLQDEKARSVRTYDQGFRRTQAEVMARLRQPSGLFALLNAGAVATSVPVRPLVLPYPALDFEDPLRAQQAVEEAGCSLRYPDGSTLCAGVGGNLTAGGFLYLVGSFPAGDLAPRDGDDTELARMHRARIRVVTGGETLAWIAPFERQSLPGERVTRGRLTGFPDDGEPLLPENARPLRDFRGWLWQSGACLDGGDPAGCARRTFYALRLPVPAFRDLLFSVPRPEWPPADLDRIRVRLQMLGPGTNALLFDSDAPGATAPASLDGVRQLLHPGETLTLRRQDGRAAPIVLRGEVPQERASPFILRLIDRLPVRDAPPPLVTSDTLTTPVGAYEVVMQGDARGVEAGLGAVATRMAWYVAAMLAAIFLAWLVMEVGLIRRITELTRRAAALSHNVQKEGGAIGELQVADLRGRDELGILAGGLADLLQRVKDDVQRQQLRAQRERDMLEAVGHEILSPLQSLMVLHPDPSDPAHRYVQRMQHAVRVLYGQASPSEALQAAELQLETLDLASFLREVAENAPHAGITGVAFDAPEGGVTVRGDPFPLEDVVTHILRNADRHRTPGTPIRLTLAVDDGAAHVGIHNVGPGIDPALLERIFDYGVSDGGEGDEGRRGQGLFVARTYLAKMGGAIRAENADGGVRFVLTLPRATAPRS